MVRLTITALLALLLARATAAPAAPGFILEVELANERGGAAQLFYDIGQWYSVVHSSRVEIPAGAALQAYRFTIPAQPVRRLRFDPADGVATIKIGQLRLLTAGGAELARFGPERLLPMHSIADLRVADGVATVVTEADDPMLLIAQPLQRLTTHTLGRTIVTPWQVVTFALAVGGCMAVALVAAGRGIVAAGRPRAGWLLGGFFLVVFGARLFWLQRYSLPLPFWDEWKTTAIDLLMPLRGGYLDWQALFLPHGEHRIVVTRLASLASALLNGEWDPRVAMTLGAFFLAATFSLVCGAMTAAARWPGFVLALCLGALACLPFDTRNLYWGDQSQMYALTLFGACTLAVAAAPRITRLAVIGGTAAALVSLVTMGSGFIAPGLAAGICLARLPGEREQRRPLALLAAIFLLVSVIGLVTVRAAPYQGAGYARTVAEFWPAFVARAAWPLPPRLPGALVAWLPCLLLALTVLREGRACLLDRLALGLGAWALVNALGLAYARTAEMPPFDSKYYTAMSMTVVAGTACAAALLSRWPAWRVFATAGLLAALASMGALFPFGRTGIQASKDQLSDRQANEQLVRTFLASGDPASMRATPWHRLPYWNGTELADLLDDPLLQPVLPAGLRESLAQRPGLVSSRAPAPGPLTRVVRILMQAGPWLFAGGCLALLWFQLASRHSPAAPSPR